MSYKITTLTKNIATATPLINYNKNNRLGLF